MRYFIRNWLLRSSSNSTTSTIYQAFIGFSIFLGLGFLYGLGSWLAKFQANTSVWDVKTTQEGFLEVSKILGDPKTTTHPSSTLSETLSTKDLYSTKWTKDVPNICQNKPKTQLLVTVISAPTNFEERKAIRFGGWGETAKNMSKVAFAFLVGYSEEFHLDLEYESDLFGDMIITDHVDSYNNLTLKTLAAFDWMQTYCKQAEYLLKTDDDMFIQIYRLMAVIRGLRTSAKDQELIVGNVASGWTPVRNPQSKYFITEDQYSEASYPPFVTGPSYLVSRLAVKNLFAAALEHPFLHLEDVFLTGIIAEQCGIPRRLATEFRNNAVRIPVRFMGCTLLRTIAIHKVQPSEQAKMSKMAQNPQCGSGRKNGKAAVAAAAKYTKP